MAQPSARGRSPPDGSQVALPLRPSPRLSPERSHKHSPVCGMEASSPRPVPKTAPWGASSWGTATSHTCCSGTGSSCVPSLWHASRRAAAPAALPAARSRRWAARLCRNVRDRGQMVRVTQGAPCSLALSPGCQRGFGAAVGAAGGGTWGQAPGSATRGDSRAGPALAMNVPPWACSCAQHRCQKNVSPWPPSGEWHSTWSKRRRAWSKHPGAPGPLVRPVPTPNWVPPAGVFFPGGDEGSWEQARCLESTARAPAHHFTSGNSCFFQSQLLPPQQSRSGRELPPGTGSREMAADQPPFCSPAQGTVGDWKVVLFHHYIWRHGDPRIEFMH